MNKYIPKEVESKWQKRWQDEKVNRVDLEKSGKKYYLLVELPYSSGDLHIGHWFAFAVTDIFGRFKKMQGFDVFFPVGFDAFGLPAENAAIKRNLHPRDWTLRNIETMTKQFQLMGAIHDWEHVVITCLPEYYKWNQWIFLKMLERGIAYRGKKLSNWCPVDQTVLADEQVVSGKCDRCGSDIELKEVNQWFLKITDYADKLLWKGNEKVDWPKSVIEGQNNWIGKSEGIEIDFPLKEDYNFVLLHGFGGTPQKDFFPWLAKKLQEKGHMVQVPSLPNTDNPAEAEQVDLVLKNCKFDKNTILLGHSLGTVVSMKVLEKLKDPISGLVLVAGFTKPEFKDKKVRPFKDKFGWEFDFEKIKTNAANVVILSDLYDPIIPIEEGRTLARELGGELREVRANATHFNSSREPSILSGIVPSIRVFTKFPETIFGVTYMVLAPEHHLIKTLTTDEYKDKIDKYIKASHKKSEQERISQEKEKTGVFTGAYCINLVNGKEVPIWIADYVIASYGTGAVMGVPGSDTRDFEFAKKFDLPIIKVIGINKGDLAEINSDKDVLEEGYIVNSGEFDGLASPDPAKKKFMDWLEEKGWGIKKINYHLHDWSISRQRYWGTPIPVINCPNCGIVPVPYEDLPVQLPYDIDHSPKGKPPLATAEKWMHVKCPNCGGDALREPETMDGFFDNSWYFFRYLDPKNNREIFNADVIKKWMPIDIYFGGAEHTLGHTMYSRFFTKFFKDIGLVKFDEYAQKRVNHGVILGPDSHRMSKSRGNVVNPDEQVAEYGADAIRLYLAFIGPYDLVAPWDPGSIRGVYHFLQRVWALAEKVGSHKSEVISHEDQNMMHKTIKKVTEDIENNKFNTAVAALMEWLNYLSKRVHSSSFMVHGKSKSAMSMNYQPLTINEYEVFLKLLAPFAPHITEELYQQFFGNPKSEIRNPKFQSIHNQTWPKYGPKLVQAKKITLVVQVNGKLRDRLLVEAGLSQGQAEKLALTSAKVLKYLENKKPRKVIYVADRLINFVV